MNVVELLLFFAQMKGSRKNDAKEKIDNWLDRLTLSNWSKKGLKSFLEGDSKNCSSLGLYSTSRNL